jgi:2-hydroxy-3-keto-5-methylthiopentenyl-1-phosphate phosphatase
VRLVLDWDGTVTEVDSLHLVLEQFGDPDVYRDSELALGRKLTLHEVIALEFETVTAPVEEVAEWLLGVVRIRDGFRELAARHRPLVISAGFHELIEPVLEREGVELEVLANRLDPRPDGWRIRWRDETVCATCGESCKRGVLAGEPYVYVGDGYSDRCAALAARRVFARNGLARYLDERGAPFERFESLRDVAAALEESPFSGAVERPTRSRGRKT